MIDSDASWVVKYLASKKELSQSFDTYLNKILEGFNPEIFPQVHIRAKAMKCLTQIVEADHHVLMIVGSSLYQVLPLNLFPSARS